MLRNVSGHVLCISYMMETNFQPKAAFQCIREERNVDSKYQEGKQQKFFKDMVLLNMLAIR